MCPLHVSFVGKKLSSRIKYIFKKKMRFMAYRKFYSIFFHETFKFEVPDREWYVQAKNQDRSPSIILS